MVTEKEVCNEQARPLSDILLQIAADPTDPFSRTLRLCSFIQVALIKQGLMSLDDLTNEQIDRLIEWDQKQK